MAAPKKKKKIVKKVTTVKRKMVVKKLVRKVTALNLIRSHKNPIIVPSHHSPWESKATFNPTALYADGKVHIIYRAIGDNDVSVLGYTSSHDGFTIGKEPKEIAFYSKSKPVKRKGTVPIIYGSGGGWGGGSEDPRLTLLGHTVYMIYTSFDGWGSVRIALTSISLKDFLARHWHWKKPVFISPPGEVHKNWVLFPEKINGKYAILHSLSPEIRVDYLKSLKELDGETFIKSVHQSSPLWQQRDKFIRGVGPSPLKTKYGWLILYHKMEEPDSHRYKLWVMILDANDPTKILYKSNKPILEPDFWYENEGYKGGVVYSCGAIIKEGQLFVYYGGADKVSCVAWADLDTFLAELVRGGTNLSKTIKLKD